jgi:hypothetical protein
MVAGALDVEDPPDQPTRTLTNEDHVGGRESLQARGKVGRLANDRLLAGHPRADDVADDDEASGDADPRLERPPARGREPRHRSDNAKRGAHRALCAVFMRMRKAEISERTPSPISLTRKSSKRAMAPAQAS